MADINVYITSHLTSSERRVSPLWSLEYFQQRLEQITGVPPECQELVYYGNSTSNDNVKIEADPNTKLSSLTLAAYSRIHVVDIRPDSELTRMDSLDNELNEDEMFVLKEEDYAKRSDSVLKWKEENKLGRFDPEYQAMIESVKSNNVEIAETIVVNSRCRIFNIEGERRGTVRYVGKIPEIDHDSVWVGIEFDEPVGKNDGTIGTKRYFNCRLKHGSFVKPEKVEIGDYPELSLFSDDDDEEL